MSILGGHSQNDGHKARQLFAVALNALVWPASADE
jgi:hypothetical protein